MTPKDNGHYSPFILRTIRSTDFIAIPDALLLSNSHQTLMF